MPTQQGQSQLLLTAMGQLSQTIQQLDQHMQNSDQAAQQRVQQTNLNQQVQAQSQNASPTQAAGRWGGGASTYMQDLNELDTMRSVPQQSGQNESTPPGSTADIEHQAQQSQQPQESSQQQTEQAMAFSLLGPEGGPAGAYYRKQYSINRNLAWAQTGSTLAQTQLNNLTNSDTDWGVLPSAGSSMFGGLNKALGWAQGTNPGQSAVSRALGQGTSMAIGAGIPMGINVATNWNDLGSELGYAQQGTPRSLGGFNIGPLSNLSATGEGAALHRETSELSGRGINNLTSGDLLGSLTHDQAQSAVETLAAQGFGTTPLGQGGQGLLNSINGNNNLGPSGANENIATNLLAPLMQGGLSAQDAAQWTTSLRNSGASVTSLMNVLGDLGTMAKQVGVPVAQMNSELEAVAQTAQQYGSFTTTGMQAGENFQAATGLQAQNMAQFYGSPMYQALASFQNGVNPLQVGGLSAGSQTQAALSTVQLLASISGGLGQGKNQYKMINGQRILTQSGAAENIAMVQQLLQQQGINMSPQEIGRMLSEGKHPQQIANLEGILGTQPTAYTTGTGLYHLSPTGREKAWRSDVAPQMQSLEREGILSQSQIKKIDAAKTVVGKGSKSQLLMQALEKGQQGSKQNQVQVHVTVGFTGSAKGVLKQTGKASSQINLAKIQQNSGGGPLTNTMLNTPGGDSASASDAMMNNYINSLTSDNNNLVTTDNNSLITNDNNSLLTP